jgi:hypothetical protein
MLMQGTHKRYFIAELVLKSKAVARFKLYHGLTITCSEIGNKNIPPAVRQQKKIKRMRIINEKYLPLALVTYSV